MKPYEKLYSAIVENAIHASTRPYVSETKAKTRQRRYEIREDNEDIQHSRWFLREFHPEIAKRMEDQWK